MADTSTPGTPPLSSVTMATLNPSDPKTTPSRGEELQPVTRLPRLDQGRGARPLSVFAFEVAGVVSRALDAVASSFFWTSSALAM